MAATKKRAAKSESVKNAGQTKTGAPGAGAANTIPSNLRKSPRAPVTRRPGGVVEARACWWAGSTSRAAPAPHACTRTSSSIMVGHAQRLSQRQARGRASRHLIYIPANAAHAGLHSRRRCDLHGDQDLSQGIITGAVDSKIGGPNFEPGSVAGALSTRRWHEPSLTRKGNAMR